MLHPAESSLSSPSAYCTTVGTPVEANKTRQTGKGALKTMLKPNGAAELTAFTEKSYKETITPIVPGIWHVLGVGHSNAVIIEGRTSVILVDTLDTLERGQKLLEIIRSRTEKPVKTILYTPGSPGRSRGVFRYGPGNHRLRASNPCVEENGNVAGYPEPARHPAIRVCIER